MLGPRQPARVLLFGSYARGDAGPDSHAALTEGREFVAT
jgi:predicted nucleotidyltransferase